MSILPQGAYYYLLLIAVLGAAIGYPNAAMAAKPRCKTPQIFSDYALAMVPGRELAPPLGLQRPTDNPGHLDNYELGTKVRTLGSENFLIWFTTDTGSQHQVSPQDDNNDGKNDYAALVLDTLEYSFTAIVSQQGYKPPTPDDTLGKDARVDIYLLNILSDGLYGYAVPQFYDDAGLTTALKAQLATTPENDMPGYIVLDNDYAELNAGAAGSLIGLQVSVAHELFHLSQFSYDYQDAYIIGPDGTLLATNIWFLEATATANEEQVYPDANDYINYLDSDNANILNYAHLPTDTFWEGLFVYSTAIFPLHLQAKWGSKLLRQAWEASAIPLNISAKDSWINPTISPWSALTIAGAKSDISLTEMLASFFVARYFTGSRSYAFLPPEYSYQDATSFAEVPTTLAPALPFADFSGEYLPRAYGASYYELTPKYQDTVVIDFSAQVTDSFNWELSAILIGTEKMSTLPLNGLSASAPSRSSELEFDPQKYHTLVLIVFPIPTDPTLVEVEFNPDGYEHSLAARYLGGQTDHPPAENPPSTGSGRGTKILGTSRSCFVATAATTKQLSGRKLWPLGWIGQSLSILDK